MSNFIDDDLIEVCSDDIYENEYTEDNLISDLHYSHAKNVIINRFNNHTEITVYKKAFFIPEKYDDTVDRTRKFYYDENGELQIAREGITFNDLDDFLPRSRRRALDTFLGYALSNSWRYFVTLTFDSKKVNRTSKDDICYVWQLVRQKLQYKYPNVQIILISEEHHTDGCLHFHALFGKCDLSAYLIPAINNMQYLNTFDYYSRKKVYKLDFDGNPIPNKYYGQLLKTDFGDQVYNFRKELYDVGFSSIVELHHEDIPGDNDKVVMYLLKYMTKDNNSAGYNKKSYYRTMNLDYKEKIITKSIDPTTGQVLNELLVNNKIVKKENDKMTVYIIPGNKDYSEGNIYDKAQLLKLSEDGMPIKPVTDIATYNQTDFYHQDNIFD